MIGIFKVNSSKDGGYYIDIYLNKILNKSGFGTKNYIFLATNNTHIHPIFEQHCVNYKNPIFMLPALYKIIKKDKIKIAYTNQFITLFFLILLKKTFLQELKVIAKVDGLTIKNGLKRYFYKIYDFFWYYSKKNSDFIIFETKNAKSTFVEINNQVIYTPAINFYELELVHLSVYDLKQRFGNFSYFILYVGRFSEEKGYDRIIKIAEEFPKYGFLMIGGTIESDQSNVFSLGFKDITEIVRYYNSVDILIIPSRDDSFPTVIREFSYFQKPIIATNVGSIAEYKDLGLEITICDNDTNDIIEVLREFDFSKLNLNKDVYNENFNANDLKIIKKYLKIFKNLKE